MKREERIDYWLSVADYDLETAEAMYSTGRWLYVAFMCHQVIEKTLKAYWCATQEDEPPYVHNHKRLAAGCGLYDIMSEQQKDFLNTVTTTTSRPVIQSRKMRLLANSTRMPAATSSTKPKHCNYG